MLGTIVNTLCIVAGSCIGSIAKRAIRPQYQGALYNAMGLAAFVLGINAVVTHLPNSQYPVLFIVSLAIGTLIGTILDLAGKFNRVMKRFSKSAFPNLIWRKGYPPESCFIVSVPFRWSVPL